MAGGGGLPLRWEGPAPAAPPLGSVHPPNSRTNSDLGWGQRAGPREQHHLDDDNGGPPLPAPAGLAHPAGLVSTTSPLPTLGPPPPDPLSGSLGHPGPGRERDTAVGPGSGEVTLSVLVTGGGSASPSGRSLQLQAPSLQPGCLCRMPPRAPLDQAWSPQLPVGWRPGAMVSEPAIPAAERTQMRP